MENQMIRTKKCILQSVFSVLLLIVTTSASSQNATLKPRLVVLTDISLDEPDDHQSLIRLLVHADMYEIEGIVLTTGWSVRHPKEDMDKAKGTITAYGKDLPNLMKRSNQIGFSHDDERQKIGYWPSAQYLTERTVFGSLVMGIKYIGANNNSAGSDLLIRLADEADDRPIWVVCWGGGNTLAQAIWKVQQTRSAPALKAFLNKFRVYTQDDQDRANPNGTSPYTSLELSSHAWMRREFSGDLLFIWDNAAGNYMVGAAKRGLWPLYVAHIQHHGNLGNQYPMYHYGVEGDTPSFLHLMPNGLNNPDVPTQAGWGGYSEWGLGEDNNGYAYVNRTGDAHTICRKYAEYFYPATFNNFAARMDWANEGKGNRNPIAIINGNEGIEILKESPRQGATITLDASKSYDPDGDTLTFKWWIQPEAGSYAKEITLTDENTSAVHIEVPCDSAGKAFHVICEITDKGAPKLTSYRRIIFEPKKI
jgi:hypothetical protein